MQLKCQHNLENNVMGHPVCLLQINGAPAQSVVEPFNAPQIHHAERVTLRSDSSSSSSSSSSDVEEETESSASKSPQRQQSVSLNFPAKKAFSIINIHECHHNQTWSSKLNLLYFALCLMHLFLEKAKILFHMSFNYRVTIQVVPSLPLTSKQKFRFSMRPMYVAQPEWSPCTPFIKS